MKQEELFEARLAPCLEEMRWLYFSLYGENEEAFSYFLRMLEDSLAQRKPALRRQDEQRLADPDWCRSSKMLGMMLYPSCFAGTLNGVREKLPYLEECGVNYLHLMPLLDSPAGKSDGGYAVSDFRKVRPDLGTMEDLENLADACREKGIALCLDFVLNHTSEEHPWAKAARAGDPVARSRYFFYDNWSIPAQFEQTVPQVFPTTAPGNFTYLRDCGQYVMTSFYPFQWDLNYGNPMVLNDMTGNLLYLANRGMDVIRLDAVPYIWKQLGTSCRNLPQVHTLVRLIHLACQVVCPGVLLLGEVVMEPSKVAPYFGTPERPECDMLYNVTTMCTTWNTVATRDVGLLRHQMEQVCALPRTYLFQNYLRCHDDIGWGLDYPWLFRQQGQKEVPHKKYLNDWFTGRWPGSWSRGELYNDDPRLGDARLCGTTASLCGVESALVSGDPDALERGIRCDLMLHAWMFSQSGIPVLYSGDEVGRLNDYNYHGDPAKFDDSRYLHRGKFQWDQAALCRDESTVPGRIFQGLRRLETIRGKEQVFRADAEVTLLDAWNGSVLAIRRRYGEEELIALFNFSEQPQTAACPAGRLTDLVSGQELEGGSLTLPGYGFLWLKKN
ncbi:alpha-amylase family glycosyl hydrolase [Intestinimonas massiliensis (ex Afouda et al. 2020)]|uniref:alpha-amylase family glycosyl hydrolase n=1 Tax=Intestinimonas massiliensis (ex Afouda et al. 2020) TaxID=1673721 RepID=UPI0034A06633